MKPHATLHALLESLAAWGARPALGLRGVCGSYWFSYLALYRAAHAVAANLAELGLPSGARIVLWAPNSPEWIACLLGAAMQGLVTVPCDAAADENTLGEIIRQTGAALVIRGPKQRLSGTSTPSQSILEITRNTSSNRDFAECPVTPDHEAVILFTSGTAGDPRGVVLTHGNLMSQLAGFRHWRPATRIVPVRMLALSPLSHVQGLILGGLLPLSLGLSVLYAQSVDPEATIAGIRLGRIAILLAVPRMLELLERKLIREIEDRFGYNMRSTWRLLLMRAFRLILGPRFRIVFTGGATLTLQRERFWRRAGTLLVQGYGATETSAIATVNWPFTGRAGSVGKARNNGAIRLADDGEIEIRGPHVSPGYAATEGVDREALELTRDGYYRTGDLGRLDSRDRLFLTGRKRDLIVTAEGNNVNPAKIELLLEACPGVRAALVAGVLREGGEEIHSVLLMHPNGDAAQAVQDANARLPNGQRIQSWSCWRGTDFPRGAMGKIRRGEVIRSLQNRGTSPPDARPAAASLRECIAEPDWRRRLDRVSHYLAETNSGKPLGDMAAELRELGLDSMDLIQIAARMDEWRGDSSGTFVEQVSFAQAVPAGTAAGVRPHKESPPRWQHWPGLTALRTVVRTLFLDPVIALRLRIVTDGLSNLANLRAPCILALHAEDRRRPSDYLAVYRAVPRRLARHLLLVMRSNPPDGFAPYLHPGTVSGATPGWPHRMLLAALFHFGLPLVFPFALFPASTTRSSMLGLAHAATGIERGCCPVVVWGAGSALLAAETRCPVIPVRLRGVTVRFGVPFEVPPGMDHRTLAAAVDRMFAELML